MDDNQIVKLIRSRNEYGLVEAYAKYGRYCRSIAQNILHNPEDSEECCNDALLIVWMTSLSEEINSIKPFLGVITRNLAINRHRSNQAKKRRCPNIPLVHSDSILNPLYRESIEQAIILSELKAIVSSFSDQLSDMDRYIFTQRTVFSTSYQTLSDTLCIPKGTIKSKMHRIRKKLNEVLCTEEHNMSSCIFN